MTSPADDNDPFELVLSGDRLKRMEALAETCGYTVEEMTEISLCYGLYDVPGIPEDSRHYMQQRIAEHEAKMKERAEIFVQMADRDKAAPVTFPGRHALARVFRERRRR